MTTEGCGDDAAVVAMLAVDSNGAAYRRILLLLRCWLQILMVLQIEEYCRC